jgi:HEAT repeat protein
MIAESLGALGAEAAPAAPMLIRRAKDQKVEFRENAVHVLEKIGARAEGVLPALQAASNDPDESVRTRSSEALSALDKTGSLKSTK